MTNKKHIPAPYINKEKNLAFCKCKIEKENCTWPTCICEKCLYFKQECKCVKNEK